MKPRSFVSGTPTIVRHFIGPNKCIPGVSSGNLVPLPIVWRLPMVKLWRDTLIISHHGKRDNQMTPLQTGFDQIEVHIFSDSSNLDHYQYPMMEELPVPQVLPEPKQRLLDITSSGTVILVNIFLISECWTVRACSRWRRIMSEMLEQCSIKSQQEQSRDTSISTRDNN